MSPLSVVSFRLEVVSGQPLSFARTAIRWELAKLLCPLVLVASRQAANYSPVYEPVESTTKRYDSSACSHAACSGQSPVTVLTMSTSPAALRLAMTWGHVPRSQIPAHRGQPAQQFLTKGLGVINTEDSLTVLEVPVARALPVFLLHQQAVGCQLQNVSLVRLVDFAAWLEFHRNNAPPLLHQIIRFSRKAVVLRKQWLFTTPPRARVCVDDATLRQPRRGPLPLAPCQQDQASTASNRARKSQDVDMSYSSCLGGVMITCAPSGSHLLNQAASSGGKRIQPWEVGRTPSASRS